MKKILSLMLASLLLLTAFPLTAMAAKTDFDETGYDPIYLSSADVSVTPPFEGSAPSYSAQKQTNGIRVSDVNNDTVKNGVCWKNVTDSTVLSVDDNNVFKKGKEYAVIDGKSTLTMKNAIIDTGTKTAQGATFGIKGLNIVVEGDCRIIDREVNGIKLTQNATITGGGTLTVTGKSSGISYDGDGDIELTVEKTALNVSGSIGINGGSSPSGKKLTINCSDVTAEGSNSAINYLGEITLNDAEIITPKGGEIKSSATWDGSPSLGIYDGSTLSKKAVIAAKPNAQTMIGDVNGDGNVTIDDATLVQKAIAELIELDDTQKKAADTNSDEKITIDDATMIQKYIAELIDHLG